MRELDPIVVIDRKNRVITICGIKYAFDLFEGLGFKINPSEYFQIIDREDGVVTIRSVRLQETGKCT